jgi:hypothetical protein
MPRRPKVETMPPEVRAWLERVLIDRTHPGYMALAEELRARGYEISHSAIHRYDQRLQRVMARIRASTEAARLIAQASPDESDEHSAAVLRMVQSALFEAMTSVAEAEGADPERQVKLLSSAARAVAEASRASIGQKKWAEEVRARLDAVERTAAREGKTLDAATLQAIKQGLYGG